MLSLCTCVYGWSFRVVDLSLHTSKQTKPKHRTAAIDLPVALHVGVGPYTILLHSCLHADWCGLCKFGACSHTVESSWEQQSYPISKELCFSSSPGSWALIICLSLFCDVSWAFHTVLYKFSSSYSNWGCIQTIYLKSKNAAYSQESGYVDWRLRSLLSQYLCHG